MDWKTFIICLGGIALTLFIVILLHEAGKAEVYKIMCERNKEIADKLLEKTK